jgi:hypothetical protein
MFSLKYLRLARVVSSICLVTTALIAAAEGAASAEERIPVLAWGGIPAAESTPERYRELADAGFTHNFSSFSNAASVAAALDVAHAAGVKQFLSIPELQKEPEETARRFKGHPALAGYYLRDEPGTGDFVALAAWAKRIQSVDSVHGCYINLFPNYANAGQLGAPSYREYVQRFLAEVPVPYLSFDHYPVVGQSLRAEWYENLEIIAENAKAAKKPFWAFVLAVAHAPYPVPSVEHLRLQAFSDLAYGAQAIQYFTYWTPTPGTWDFHDGPIDVKGQRTPVYDRVKQVNAEVRTLSPVFLRSEVRALGYTGELPRGTKKFAPEAPIKDVQSEGGGAVVSLLQKGTRRHLVIVNRELQNEVSVRVDFDSGVAIREFSKVDGKEGPLPAGTFARKLTSGDIAVLVWDAP